MKQHFKVMEIDSLNLNLDMIIDDGKTVGNKQKYVHLLEYQPQSYPVFYLNLH